MLSIGLMSGTSMDGIDAALLETDGEHTLQALGHASLIYDSETQILLKSAERAVKDALGDMEQAEQHFTTAIKNCLTQELLYSAAQCERCIKQLNHYLQAPLTLSNVIEHSTRLHHRLVNQLLSETGHVSQSIDLIGYHGQTLYHQPSQKKTIQVGDGALLARLSGTTVINDFRRQDVAAGGQGAPFAPIYHLALARRGHKIPVVIVNCGGIANASFIPDERIEHLIGLDTGPGNGLIDALIKKRTMGRESMDTHGHYGLKGCVNEAILNTLFQESLPQTPNYFLLPPPKSLDLRDFVLIPALDALSLEDACRTLEAFTAECMVRSAHLLPSLAATIPTHWILAGGGGYNPVIKQELLTRLKTTFGDHYSLETASEAGWGNCAIEAELMAYFAVRSLKNLPLSMPGTTRVPMPLSGGTAHRPPAGATPAVNALLIKNHVTLTDNP
jgi:anhydro-N-acetylmuramic acid kinase